MADRHLKEAKIKAEIRAMLRVERDRCAMACNTAGYELLAIDNDGHGLAMQEAAEYCEAAIQALKDET